MRFFPIEQWLDFNWNGFFVIFVGAALLLSELAIQANDYIREKVSASRWFEKLSLEKILLAAIFLISMILVIMNTSFQTNYFPLSWWELSFYFVVFCYAPWRV